MKILEKNAIVEAEMMEFGRQTKNLLGSHHRWPISNRKLYKFERIWILAQNEMSTKTKILRKNFILAVEMIEFDQKMKNLLQSARWPISNKKVTQICVNLNSGIK